MQSGCSVSEYWVLCTHFSVRPVTSYLDFLPAFWGRVKRPEVGEYCLFFITLFFFLISLKAVNKNQTKKSLKQKSPNPKQNHQRYLYQLSGKYKNSCLPMVAINAVFLLQVFPKTPVLFSRSHTGNPATLPIPCFARIGKSNTPQKTKENCFYEC